MNFAFVVFNVASVVPSYVLFSAVIPVIAVISFAVIFAFVSTPIASAKV